MTIWEIILIGLSLSMDAFAVSVTDGMMLGKVRKRFAFAIALTFGAFQAVMPMLGYALVWGCGHCGKKLYQAIRGGGHWAAMALLILLGAKMIIEGAKGQKDGGESENASYKQDESFSTPRGMLAALFIQGVSTSIDALAVGISLGAMGGGVIRPAFIIGITTAVICFPAVYLGKKANAVLGKWATAAGGIVLSLIGIRIGITG